MRYEDDGDYSLINEFGPLKVGEWFAGGGGNENIHAGWGQAARDRGHDVKTNEIMYAGNTDEVDDKGKHWANKDLGYTPDLAGDIRNFNLDDVLRLWGGKTPDVAYFSPPCEGQSVSARMQGWQDWMGHPEKKKAFNQARNSKDADYFKKPNIGPTPSNESAHLGRELMNHSFNLIDEMQDYRLNNEGKDADDPMYYWLENPTGMMRYQPEVGLRPLAQPADKKPKSGKNAPWPSVTHASYSGPYAKKLGFERHDIPGHPSIPSRKPTDLWSNAGGIWTPRPHTKIGLHQDANVFGMTLEEIQSKFGNRVKEMPKRPLAGKEGHSGKYHAFAPRGAKSGVQDIKSHTLPSGLVMPQYQMRSLIPYGLGEDTIRAVERARAGVKGQYPQFKSNAISLKDFM